MRYDPKAIDAKRGVQQMVISFASGTTLHTRFWVIPRRGSPALRAVRCCSSLIWNNQTAQLAPSPARKTGLSHNRFLMN